jgi:hypothetical protein
MKEGGFSFKASKKKENSLGIFFFFLTPVQDLLWRSGFMEGISNKRTGAHCHLQTGDR